jgi:hypothetical protein
VIQVTHSRDFRGLTCFSNPSSPLEPTALDATHRDNSDSQLEVMIESTSRLDERTGFEKLLVSSLRA